MWKAILADDSCTDNLTRAILSTVIFVGNKLEQNKTVLLPQAASFLKTILHLELKLTKTIIMIYI